MRPAAPPADRAGVDPDHGRARLERRADRGEPRAAEPDDADVGVDRAVERRRVLPRRRIAPHGCGRLAHRRGILDGRAASRVARMPIEPPPCQWAFPPAEAAGEEGLLALGADLAPGTLLAAYRAGIFPMPLAGVRGDGLVQPRPARRRPARRVPPRALAAPLRAPLHGHRRPRVRATSSPAARTPRRPGGWITPAMRAAYVRLHELGWAHSIEVWDDGRRARRRALRRRDRRPVRRRVEVPRPHRRVEGRAGRARRAAARRRAARACSTCSGRRRTCARSARATSRAPTTWRGCRRRSRRRRRSRDRPGAVPSGFALSVPQRPRTRGERRPCQIAGASSGRSSTCRSARSSRSGWSRCSTSSP